MNSRNCCRVESTRLISIVLAVIASIGAQSSFGHFGPIPMSLKDVPVPSVPGLTDGPDPIVVDRNAAIVLGKALFWDVNVGSDGMACASCHFHAGADVRTKNQVAPSASQGFDDDGDFGQRQDGRERGPNYALTREDFPLHQTTDPLNPSADVVTTSDDVIGSSGSFGGEFRDVSWFGDSDDECLRSADPVFHLGALGTRRVAPRHAPTVINAVFNYRNFWDGRANNVFNGSSAWGERDPDAGVWVNTPDGLQKQRLHLINSSLASQAVAPPLNTVEMGCAGRRFADLGRKLMWRRPLEKQKVQSTDSVLGPHSLSTAGEAKNGLNTFYYHLVKKAFNEKYWNSGQRGGVLGAPVQHGRMKPLPYDQYEANFAMFFALAIQLYESTLVSDDSPFDRAARDEQGLPIGLTDEEFDGLQEFRVAHCSLCHIGPLMTSAAVATNAELVKNNPSAFGNQLFAISTSDNVITRRSVLHERDDGGLEEGGALQDTGFTSTGVILSEWDAGLGGTDPFGNPLSFAEQYLQLLSGNASKVVDDDVYSVRPCDFDLPLAVDLDRSHPLLFTRADGIKQQAQSVEGCYNSAGAFVPTEAAAAAALDDPDSRKMLAGVRGAFKIPTLRNVELTGPYMHNGSMATLEEVVEFYTRGGNFNTQSKDFGFVFSQAALRFYPEKRASIVAFLKTLTDDRVRYERAPFDHPELIVPHGHTGDGWSAVGGNPLSAELAEDEFLVVPAVGAEGRDYPISEFVDLLVP